MKLVGKKPFFNIHSVWFRNNMLGSMWSQNYTHGHVDSIFCLFLFDWTARINPIEVLACRGSFDGFETICFQLDWTARIETTVISYFSCNGSPLLDWLITCSLYSP